MEDSFPGMIPWAVPDYSLELMGKHSEEFLNRMQSRRSVRSFSRRSVPRQLIERLIETASTAPSGANRQPWTFVCISDEVMKQRIRDAVEAEERQTYEQRMPTQWREALEPIGTNWHKPCLTDVPWIVVVFEHVHDVSSDGATRPNYYVKESVGIACGLFIAAVHHAGLATVPHTPSPMGFLSDLLDRPENERPYLLFPVGFAAEGVMVPDLQRKPLERIAVWRESRDDLCASSE